MAENRFTMPAALRGSQAGTGTVARPRRRAPFASGDLRGLSSLQPRIVIVGGGAGGLELATRLARRFAKGTAEVILVDRLLRHAWKPQLHEVAAGSLGEQRTAVDFLALARRHGFSFHPGELECVDRANRAVWLAPLVDEEGREVAPRRAVGYHLLVLALGSVVNDFGTPGAAEFAFRLDDLADAERFHRRLVSACARAELRGTGPVEIAIVGGGATGVELAAELSEAVADIAGFGCVLRQLGQPVRLRIVESGARLLGALPEPIARRAHEGLGARGIEVLLGRSVVRVGPGEVLLSDGQRLAADLTAWCAGIKGPPVLEGGGIGLERGPRGQLVVRPTLQTSLDDDIYAMGDCASCVAPGEKDGAAVPATAQAAQQQAHFLAREIHRRLSGLGGPGAAFAFRDRGSLVSLGRGGAVGALILRLSGRRFLVEGSLARWAYWVVQQRHMAALFGRWRAALALAGDWLTGKTRARVKLH